MYHLSHCGHLFIHIHDYTVINYAWLYYYIAGHLCNDTHKHLYAYYSTKLLSFHIL